MHSQVENRLIVGNAPLHSDRNALRPLQHLKMQTRFDVVVIGQRHQRLQAQLLFHRLPLQIKCLARRQRRRPIHLAEVDGPAFIEMHPPHFALDYIGGHRNLGNVMRQPPQVFARMHRMAVKGYAGTELSGGFRNSVVLYDES